MNKNTYNILKEHVSIGTQSLLDGTLNNTIKHLLPGVIHTIQLNWLVLRYNHVTKRYQTEDVPNDVDSRFSLKLLFLRQS